LKCLIDNFELNKFEEAIQCFDMAISINKNSPQAYNNKGNAYARLGDFERAISCFNSAISLDPTFEEAINNRANALFQQGHFEKSMKSFNKLSKDHESEQLFLNNKAHALSTNSRFPEAIECLDKCMSIKDDTDQYREALLEKAAIFSKLKRYDEALVLLNKLIDMKEIHVRFLECAHYLKGKVNFFLKKYDQAAFSYEKAIELNSTDPAVYESYGDLLITFKR